MSCKMITFDKNIPDQLLQKNYDLFCRKKSSSNFLMRYRAKKE